MNERIKELIKGSVLEDVLKEHFSEFGVKSFDLKHYPEVEQFAESIVYDILNELTNDDSLGEARIETIRRLAERYGVAR